MNFFRMFARQTTSAPVARERLQILLAHERKSITNQGLMATLHKEVLAAICKHIAVDADKVEVKMHERDSVSMLEIDIEIEPSAWKDVAAVGDSDLAAA